MKTTLLLLLISWPLAASEFPTPYNSEQDPSQPMDPSEAAANMALPPGFKATVFAAEPAVQNPIAMAWDARGRLWVAENYTYAESGKKFDLNLRDRILIFEDQDGDGRFDTRKVFTDDLQMLTSLEVGQGGVWVMCPPQLRFIPDRDGDDIPDGPGEVLLDGFTGSPDMHHTFANGLRFGPDGWLYGRCGASSMGEPGRPGAPAAQRVPLRGTMWRFDPRSQVVEVLSSGTTNPWGHDWNEWGELFFINTVNGHLWHGIPGAHFVRPHTFDPNPRVYTLIDQHADHWHFDTARTWQQSRNGAADDLGGGHAHIGMMIYQGDNWPAEYRGHLFTLNLHGRRANQEILERQGSGYVGKHGRDFFVAKDPWFRGMDLSYGPDGGVYVLDWSDTGECHEYSGVHRTSGRIYKITYGQPNRPEFGDIRKLTSAQLVQLHTHTNEWFSRQARLELTARAQSAQGTGFARKGLRELFEHHRDPVIKLRALWSLYCIGAADEVFLRAQLHHADEHVRTWAVRLLTDHWPLDTVLSQRPGISEGRSPSSRAGNANRFPAPATVQALLPLAKTDPSGLVRLALASTLQRLPVPLRAKLAGPLMAHAEDATDHNLPLLIWYGLIPVGETDPAALAPLAARSQLPFTRQAIARRLVEEIDRNPGPLNALLQLTMNKPGLVRADVLNGMKDGLTGWRKATKPAAWDDFSLPLRERMDLALRDRINELDLLFGEGRALDAVKKVALDPEADLSARKTALQTLIDSHAEDLRPICERLLDEQFVNVVAARGLAGFDDAAAGAKLVRAYRRFHPSERGQLLSTLVSRVRFAEALLNAVAEGKIPRADISAFQVRQIRSLNEPSLDRKLTETWGEFRPPSADKQQQISRWKNQLGPALLARADKSQGRSVFNATCASCHTLYGEGGKVGPDLTGSGRANLDYLLENLVDPSAVVTADFRMSIVELKDGRVLNGLVGDKTERTLTLKTSTESLTLERSEIVTSRESSLSLMPEGILDGLSIEQVRNLVAYLMHPSQVPMPAQRAAK